MAVIERSRQIMKKLIADDLLKHTGILFSGMMVVHVCNLIFQMAVSRALPKDEYVLLTAFFGVLAIISRPLSTLTTGVSHYSSLLRQEERTGDVKRLLRKWGILTGTPAIAIGALAVALASPLAEFFHLDRTAPVVLAGVLLPALFCGPVLSGACQGLQRFGWSSAAAIFGALTRLTLGAGLVWFVYPACGWAMLGHGFGLYATVAVLLAGVTLTLRGQSATATALPSMRFYLLQSFFIQAAYAVLMTADVVLVKHYVPDDTEFAYAATLGRMVVFLPGAIVVAMFPKVASRGAGSREQYQVFLKSMGWTASFVVVAIVGCVIFSGLLANILFGISDAPTSLRRMIGVMALVMGFSALLNVIVNFLMAQRRFRPAAVVVGFAIAYLASVMVFHESAWQVVVAAGICNAGGLLVLMALVFYRRSGA